MENLKSKFYWTKLSLLIIIGGCIFLYENLSPDRVMIFSGLLVMMIALHLFKKFKLINQHWSVFIVELLIIFLLEYHSKYILNYFIHSLYILLILDIALNYNPKKSFILQSIVIISASYKYLYIIQIKQSIASIAQFFLFLTLTISIVIILNLLHKIYKDKVTQEQLYQQLKKSQNQLKEYAREDERHRLSREIHDTIGHQMIKIIMGLEVLKINSPNDSIDSLVHEARQTHKLLRSIVESTTDHSSSKGLTLMSVINEFKKQTKFNVRVQNSMTQEPPLALINIVKESLTNSAKHSTGNNISVTLDEDEDFIYFQIKDNGKALGSFVKGNGLTGIEKRVELFDGDVRFMINNGFTTKGFIRRVHND